MKLLAVAVLSAVLVGADLPPNREADVVLRAWTYRGGDWFVYAYDELVAGRPAGETKTAKFATAESQHMGWGEYPPAGCARVTLTAYDTVITNVRLKTCYTPSGRGSRYLPGVWTGR